MPIHKGFGLIAALVVIAGLFVIGGGAYVALKPEAASAPHHTDEMHVATHASLTSADIHWKFDDAGERDTIPYTRVSVQVGEEVHDLGEFQGSCSVVDANGGIDGKGLLAGELSAAQCWFAGGGDEIGVFAHEDGGYQVMVGSISEPDGEGSVGFRGDFKIRADISL